jgi:diguanylate cyclase (GGDEF)-like protein
VGLRILLLGRLTDDLRREIAALGGGAKIHEIEADADAAGAIRALSPDLAVIGLPASLPAFLEPDGPGAFAARVEQEYVRSFRYRHPLGLALLSLDRLAGLERTHGPEAVDAFTGSVAEAARRALREVDLLYRPSRSEIAAILPETEPTGARVVSERLRVVVAQLLFKAEWQVPHRPALPLKATASIGLTGCPAEGIGSGADLVSKARAAMEAARAAGGDRVTSRN